MTAEDPSRTASEEEAIRIALARRSPVHFCAYVLRDTKRGKPLDLQPYHAALVARLFEAPHRKVIRGHPISGKTELTIGAGLWALGRDLMAGIAPTCGWIGDTKRVALARAEAMVEYVPPPTGPTTEAQAAFARVYPSIVRGDLWNADRGYRFHRRDRMIRSKDPTVQAAGADTGIHGSHLRYLFGDDVQTYTNQRLASRRAQVYDQFVRKTIDRLEPGAEAWILFLTNTWWDDSCDAILTARHGFADLTLDVSSRNPYECGGDLGTLNWPGLYSETVIREEVAGNPLKGEVARRFWNVRLKRSERNPFKSEWIELCKVPGLRLLPRLDVLPPGFSVFTGIDLGGFDGKTSSDPSCLFTLLLRNDGLRRRRPIDVQTGRWHVHELIERMVSVHERYHSQLIVESVGVQLAVAQMAAGRELPVRPFVTTGANKWDPTLGIQSLAAEFAMGQWEVPVNEDGSMDSEIEGWVAEMEAFDPERHTGDRLVASWLAKMGAYEDFHGYAVADLSTLKPPPPGQMPTEDMIAAAEERLASDPLWGDVFGGD